MWKCSSAAVPRVLCILYKLELHSIVYLAYIWRILLYIVVHFVHFVHLTTSPGEYNIKIKIISTNIS